MTATGLPLAVCLPETRRALDIPRFCAPSPDPGSEPSGITPSSYMPWSGARAAGAFTGAFTPVPAEPVRSYIRGSGVTEPASGRAVPRALSGLPAYGNEVPSWTVRTASGSLRWRKDSQTRVPSWTPYFCWAASSESAAWTSPPPPPPNCPPTTEAIEIRSVSLNGWISPTFVIESILPVRTYSPGK